MVIPILINKKNTSILLIDYDFIQGVYAQMVATDPVFFAITGMKGLAVVLIVMRWYHKFFKSLDKDLGSEGKSFPLTPYDLLSGLALIVLVGAYDQLLGVLDHILGWMENQYIGFGVQPKLLELQDEVEPQKALGWQQSLVEIGGILRKLANDPLFLFLDLFEFLAWLGDTFMYGIFLTERFFFMGLLRVFGSLAIACSVMPKLEKWFWNWLSTYIALYLLAIPYFLINAFTFLLYQQFDTILVYGPKSLLLTCVLLFITLVKFKLYAKAHQILFKIF